MLFKLQKSYKKFSASLYQIYRTDTGHHFSLHFAYESLMNFRNNSQNVEIQVNLTSMLSIFLIQIRNGSCKFLMR